MQDRLKFRTPILENGVFVGHFVHWNAVEGRPTYTALFGDNPRALSLGDDEQCTGLFDKNGNLIYEGDEIIKHDYNALGYGRTRKCTVFWHERGYWGIETEFGDVYFLEEFDAEQLEIIGNIHTATVKDGE